MKIIFWDKERETYRSAVCVDQLTVGKAEFNCRMVSCWICLYFDGKTENFGQRRFSIERIES